MFSEMSTDFDCVYVQNRASGGIPITSGKMTTMASHQDLKESIDFIYGKYKKPIYIFAFSLGALTVTNYLIRNGDTTPVVAATLLNAQLCPEANA